MLQWKIFVLFILMEERIKNSLKILSNIRTPTKLKHVHLEIFKSLKLE
jgi:hypothetical protein